MPYIDDWAEFQAQAEALFRSRPLHTRYVLKYRHCEGRLVLKVTDDIVVSTFFMALCFAL
jgi:signal recognition particle subunit SRP9